MASAIMASHSLPVAGLRSSPLHCHHCNSFQGQVKVSTAARIRVAPIRASSKSPPGVDPPRVEPKLPLSFWGFTETAELWNARASLVGIVVIIIIETITHTSFLHAIGFDVGRGLDLPL